MGKKKTILLLLCGIILSISPAKSQETQNEKVPLPTQSINIDEMRNELEQISLNKTKTLTAKIETMANRYIVSPGDIISVLVHGEPDFTQNMVLIKSDGYATITPFGDIQLGGNNIDEVNQLLSSKFKKYLLKPQISVQINNIHSAKVYIYGAVQKPGLYQNNTGRIATTTPLTLAKAIYDAGGIKYNADIKNIKVTNTRTETTKTYNLLKLIKNGDVSQDTYLRSGDKVFIPILNSEAQLSDEEFLLISSSSIAPDEFTVRVMGAVQRPGACLLNSRSPRINTAIASSEGFTLEAKRKVVKVQRLTPQGNISTMLVNPSKNDCILRPNDIVYVVDKRTTLAGRSLSFMNLFFESFGRVGSAYNEWAEMFDPTRRYNNINN